jgi:PilZ domain-containing protein/TonB-like protein
MSTSAQQIPPLISSVERRFYPRIVPQAPIFVAFRENGSEDSLLLNVSENGLLVSTPADLACNFVARLCVRLHGLPKPLQVTARIVWASEANNLAGIQLLDLSEYDRQQIRRWGARESAQSFQTEPDQPVLVVPTSQASTETPRGAFSFAEATPVSTTHDIVPLAPPQIVHQRSTSTFARCLIGSLCLAAACLAAVFFLKNEALGNLLLHSRTKSPQTSAVLPVAQKTLPDFHSPDVLQSSAINSPVTSAPAVSATKSKSQLTAMTAPQNSVQIEQATADNGTSVPVMATEPDQREGSPTASTPPSPPLSETNRTSVLPSPMAESQAVAPMDRSAAAVRLAPTEAASESTTAAAKSSALVGPSSETLPVAPDPPTSAQPLPNPTRTSEASSSPSATPPSNPIAAPTRAAFVPQPALSVIQMDLPRSQVLEVRLPGAHQASFLPLPGERVLETPSVTMRIQRSVLMPATHAGWPFNRNKKVVVGELISRVDPQAAQIPTGTANSVRVKATIAADGHIENVKSILGPPHLVPAVAKALHEWRYQPTLVDGKPVETQCYVIFQFHTPAYRAARR